MATEREPEEGNRTRQVGQDHHPLPVEPVAQDPAEGAKGPGNPVGQRQHQAQPGRGPAEADEDGVQQRGVGGRAARLGDGPGKREPPDGGPGRGPHGATLHLPGTPPS